jgi:hypothetical protein
MGMGTGGIPKTDNIPETTEKLGYPTDNIPKTTEKLGCPTDNIPGTTEKLGYPTDNIPDNRFFKTLNFIILYFYRNLSLCVNYAFNYGTITADYVTITFSL